MSITKRSGLLKNILKFTILSHNQYISTHYSRTHNLKLAKRKNHAIKIVYKTLSNHSRFRKQISAFS